MSEVLQIPFDKMKTKELRDQAITQYKAIEILQKENQLLKEKLSHMERLLVQREPKAIPLTDEEIICIEQIKMIRAQSKRELSLDEVKRLDLLIKNLRLIREQSTQVIDTKDYMNMKEADLVAILDAPNSTRSQ